MSRLLFYCNLTSTRKIAESGIQSDKITGFFEYRNFQSPAVTNVIKAKGDSIQVAGLDLLG
jgi:hypothetical protein